MKIRKDLIIAVVATFCLTATLLNTRAWIYMGGMDFGEGGDTATADSDSSVWRCERASLWITASSFEQWNLDYYGDYYWGGGFIGEGAFYAQVQLPDGVIVKNMTCIGTSESNGTVDMEVDLYGKNLSEFDKNTLWPTLHMAQAANWHRTADGPTYLLIGFDDTIDYNQIDNEHWIYWVYIRLGQFSISQEALVGVRIDYEYLY
jgi:hypothetical protein